MKFSYCPISAATNVGYRNEMKWNHSRKPVDDVTSLNSTQLLGRPYLSVCGSWTPSCAAEMPLRSPLKLKRTVLPGPSSWAEWNVNQMKDGSGIQEEDSFLTLPVFLSQINQLKAPQWSSVWQWRGIYHSQIKARSTSNGGFHSQLGIYESWWRSVGGPPSYKKESAKGHTTRRSIVFRLLIATQRMSFGRMMNTTQVQLVPFNATFYHLTFVFLVTRYTFAMWLSNKNVFVSFRFWNDLVGFEKNVKIRYLVC